MSRTKPQILLEDQQGSKIMDISVSTAVYAVFYKGRPCKVRLFDLRNEMLGFKYSKTSFNEPGHAIRLARKLNRRFNCQDFEVCVLTQGRTVSVEK